MDDSEAPTPQRPTREPRPWTTRGPTPEPAASTRARAREDWVAWTLVGVVVIVLLATVAATAFSPGKTSPQQACIIEGPDLCIRGVRVTGRPGELPSTAQVEAEFVGQVVATIEGEDQTILHGGPYRMVGACLGQGEMIMNYRREGDGEAGRMTAACDGTVGPALYFPVLMMGTYDLTMPFRVRTVVSDGVTQARTWVLTVSAGRNATLGPKPSRT